MSVHELKDAEFDVLLGRVLRAGVMLSAGVVLVGAAIYLARHGGELPHYDVFRGEPTDLRTIRGIAGDAWSMSGRGIVQLGLLLLIATPIARVMFSVVGFTRQRDWMYVAITGIVLALLLYSLLTA
jgi:uncharacterized membrane protein